MKRKFEIESEDLLEIYHIVWYVKNRTKAKITELKE